ISGRSVGYVNGLRPVVPDRQADHDRGGKPRHGQQIAAEAWPLHARLGGSQGTSLVERSLLSIRGHRLRAHLVHRLAQGLLQLVQGGLVGILVGMIVHDYSPLTAVASRFSSRARALCNAVATAPVVIFSASAMCWYEQSSK